MSSFFPKTYLYDFFSTKDTSFDTKDFPDYQTPSDFEYLSIEKPPKLYVRFAIKYKKLITTMPVIRGIAQKFKHKYHIKSVSTTEAVFNAESYMHLDSVNFIRIMYIKLLGREVDETGLNEKVQFFQRGGSREAIIYSIYTSTEFKNRFKIKDIESYKKAYRKYRVIMLFRRTPLLSAYVRAKAMDRALGDIRSLILSSNADMMQSISALRDDIEQSITAQHDSIMQSSNTLHNQVTQDIAMLFDDIAKKG